jgi:anti-anti-sigma factor
VIDDTTDGSVRITVDTTAVPGSVLIDVGGELDLLTAPALRDTLFSQVAAPGSEVILLLDAVDFMASTALGVIVEVVQSAKLKGSHLRIVCANRTVLRPLELTGLDQILDIYPTLDAIAAR